MDEFIKNTPGNGMFLYSCYKQFTNQDIINFLKEEGLEVKEERGNRIFPVSDKSADVIWALSKRLKQLDVKCVYKYNAKKIKVDGISFASKKEADYYVTLKLLTKSKEIKGTQR